MGIRRAFAAEWRLLQARALRTRLGIWLVAIGAGALWLARETADASLVTLAVRSGMLAARRRRGALARGDARRRAGDRRLPDRPGRSRAVRCRRAGARARGRRRRGGRRGGVRARSGVAGAGRARRIPLPLCGAVWGAVAPVDRRPARARTRARRRACRRPPRAVDLAIPRARAGPARRLET